MAKLNLETFKNNANATVEKQEGTGIFKEQHDVHETLNIDDLIPSKHTLRLFDTDLSALEHSINRLGQIEPIVVRQIGKEYEVLNGNRRVAVAKALGFADISADIIEASASDALFLPYMLNSHEGFDSLEIAHYLKHLKEEHSLTDETILEMTGLHVKAYKDLFFEMKENATDDFNTHFDALLKKYFKLRNGKYNITKDGIDLSFSIDTLKADPEARRAVYELIYKLSNV